MARGWHADRVARGAGYERIRQVDRSILTIVHPVVADETDRRPRGPGRPRSMASHRAILDASCALLAEGGLPALTIDRVVARAGVSKATIYRRWASKQDLALAALEHCSPEPRAPRTGRVREDLVELLRTDLCELVGTP